MTQKCCICKKATVAHWIPADPGHKDTQYYPVCVDQWCKMKAWQLPYLKTQKQLPAR